jgi:hypothetical protein
MRFCSIKGMMPLLKRYSELHPFLKKFSCSVFLFVLFRGLVTIKKSAGKVIDSNTGHELVGATVEGAHRPPRPQIMRGLYHRVPSADAVLSVSMLDRPFKKLR